jgi:hypothetical protein
LRARRSNLNSSEVRDCFVASAPRNDNSSNQKSQSNNILPEIHRYGYKNYDAISNFEGNGSREQNGVFVSLQGLQAEAISTFCSKEIATLGSASLAMTVCVLERLS